MRAILGLALLAGLVVAIVVAMRFKRFSLRTLLIAMTLVAVGLALIVYATGN